MRSIPVCLACACGPFAFAACTAVAPPAQREAVATGFADAPDTIAPPPTARLAVTLKGSGLQNYECRTKAGSAGDFEWVLVSPEATLKDGAALVGRHYGGPTWEYGDGSKVTGTVVASVPAPVAGNLPWLLLEGASTGPGVFGGVTYVQRLHTSGGVAPSDACDAPTIGTRKAVRYTADYVFYDG